LFGTPQEPSLSLLYRYWFWGWLFADASQRDLLLRTEALRHNIAHRIHLLCYMRRWTLCSMCLLYSGAVSGEGLLPTWSMVPINTGAALALVVLFVAATEWLLLSAHER
jgi:hypothetical protein